MYLLVYVGELVCLQLYVHVYILHVEYIYVGSLGCCIEYACV